MGGWRCAGQGRKREEHRIVSGERSPRARGEYTGGGLQRASGRSDVPNEYQQAQPPPPAATPSSPRPRPVLSLSRAFVGKRILFPRAWRARGHELDCSDSVFPARRTASCCSEPRLWPIEVARGEDAVVENFPAETPLPLCIRLSSSRYRRTLIRTRFMTTAYITVKRAVGVVRALNRLLWKRESVH